MAQKTKQPKKVSFNFKKLAKIPPRRLPVVRCCCNHYKCKGVFLPTYFDQIICGFNKQNLVLIKPKDKTEDIILNIKSIHKEEDIIFPHKDCYFSLSDLAHKIP